MNLRKDHSHDHIQSLFLRGAGVLRQFPLVAPLLRSPIYLLTALGWYGFDAVSTSVSYSGGCLGSSTYEGRSELRYAP